MSFVTKLDYSNNRQIKQFEFTNTQLSGSTEFGVHYSGLTGGVLESSIATTSTLINIVSTFSGNSETTNIIFGDSRMIPGAVTLVAITDSTSGDTQNGLGFLGINPYIIDGNTIYSAYTGSSYDFTVTSIEEVGVEQWTGETISNNVTILSGDSADFSGRTIWVDVLGITRTKRLILVDKPDSLTGVTTVLTRDELGDIYEVEFSAITTDNFITGATFSATTGDLTLTTVSGNSITTNLDGRYLHLSATTGDDYTTGSTFNSSTGILEFTRLSGNTYNVDLGFTSGNTSNWDTAYDDSITGITVTGTVVKTITLEQKDGGTLTANFTDSTGGGGSGDEVTGMTFNTGTGDLDLNTLSGDTITENLDGRYSLTGHTHPSDNTDDYLTGGTFNTSTGELDLNLNSGSTVTIDLDGRYLTGFTETPNIDDYLTGHTFNTGTGLFESTLQSGSTVSVNLDGRYSLTGHTHISDNTDDYVTGSTFNTGTGLLESTLQSGSTVSVNLDGRYSLTGHTHTGLADDYTTGATFNSSSGVITYTRQSGSTYNADISAYSGTTPNLQEVTDIGSTTTNQITAASFIATSGGTGGSQSFIANTPNSQANAVMAVGGGVEFGYISLTHQDNNRNQSIYMTFNPTVSGSSQYYLPDKTGSYTLPIVFTDGLTSVSASTLGIVNLSSLSGLGSLDDDYTTGATWNSSTEILEFTRQSGTTYNVDLSNTYSLTGHTHVGLSDDYTTGTTFNTSTGILEFTRLSGATYNVDLDGRYLTGFTETPNTDDYLTGHTFNTGTGLFESTLQSGSTVSINLDGRYSLTGHTHDISEITGFTDNSTNWDITYDNSITGATFNTGDGVLTLHDVGDDNNITVDLDGRYLTGFTETPNTDDYLTGHTFNTSTGLFESTLQSGSTVSVNLDGRYSLTGHTHPSDNTDDYTTGTTLSGDILEFTRISGGTYDVNLSGLTPSLQKVTDVGNITTNSITARNYIANIDGAVSFKAIFPAIDAEAVLAISGGVDRSGYLQLKHENTKSYSIRSANNPVTSGITIMNLPDDDFTFTTPVKFTDGLVTVSANTAGLVDLSTLVGSSTNDYLTGHTFNTSTGLFESTLQSGSTVNVNLDGRYALIGGGSGDDWVSGATFNTGTGDLTLTRVSGGTVVTNLDNRYSLTGHTHTEYVDTIGTPINKQLAIFHDEDTISGSTDFTITDNMIVLQPRISGDNTILKFNNSVDSITHGGISVFEASGNMTPFIGANLYLNSGTPTRYNVATSSSGIILHNSGYVGIYAGVGLAPERLRVNSLGQVGIGTTVGIASKLHIYENTSGTSSTTGVIIEQDGTGDAQLQFLLTAVRRWVMGVDNSDSDKFKISPNTDLGSGSLLSIHPTTGYVEVTGDIGANSFITSGGTSADFVKGDGSLDSNIYITSSGLSDFLPLSGGTLTGPVTGTTFNISSALLDYQENLDVDSGATEVVVTVSKLIYDAVFFDYVVKNGSDLRAGIVMAAHDGTSVTYTDTSTADLGDTSGVSFTVDISGNDLRLNATVTTDNWIIKALIRGI